jgi:hypothetical protein
MSAAVNNGQTNARVGLQLLLFIPALETPFRAAFVLPYIAIIVFKHSCAVRVGFPSKTCGMVCE